MGGAWSSDGGVVKDGKIFSFLGNDKEHDNIEMFVLNRENIFFNCRAWGMLQGAKTTKTRWSL